MFFKNLFKKTKPSNLFLRAQEHAACLYKFPYMAPASVPNSVRKDKKLMRIIVETHPTTVARNGSTNQTTISAAERISLQAEFKKRIYTLLDTCLKEDPEYGPAYLLYPRVAEYNTRAKDRERLIALSERFLPTVEQIQKGTKAYDLIKQDIAGQHGNYFEKVERHLADFHYALAKLYKKTKQLDRAQAEYTKASKLIPEVYGPEESPFLP